MSWRALAVGLLGVCMAGCATAPGDSVYSGESPDLTAPRRVAVLPFCDAPRADVGRSGYVVGAALADALRRNTRWQVIDNTVGSVSKGAPKIGAEGYQDLDKAISVGRGIGAQEVVVGAVDLYEVGAPSLLSGTVLDVNVYRVGFSFRIVDVETGETKWTGSTSASNTKSLEACAAEASKKVFDAWLASPGGGAKGRAVVAAVPVAPLPPPPVGVVRGRGAGFALVVGINRYDQLGELSNCRQDATALAGLLSGRGGYAPDRVLLQTDDAEGRASYASLTRRIGLVCKLAEPDDVLLFYFAGHGITIDGQGYLVPSDGLEAQTCISIKWLQAQMEASKAKAKVMILDACHSGSAVRGVEGIAASLTGKEGLITITSCADSELSYPEGKHGVFTSFLLSGLGGQADSNGDGKITHRELFAYVQDGMKTWCLKNGKTQCPQLFAPKAADFSLSTVSPAPTP